MKRRGLPSTLLLLILGLSACTTFNVKIDHDPSADFTVIKKFAFVGLPDAEKWGFYDNSLMHKRIESAVARELTRKGLQQVNLNQQPNMLVYYSSAPYSIPSRILLYREVPASYKTALVESLSPSLLRFCWNA